MVRRYQLLFPEDGGCVVLGGLNSLGIEPDFLFAGSYDGCVNYVAALRMADAAGVTSEPTQFRTPPHISPAQEQQNTFLGGSLPNISQSDVAFGIQPVDELLGGPPRYSYLRK